MKKLIFAVAIILVTGVAFGQTLQKGKVVALHRLEITLNTGVSIDQFLGFWENKVIPQAENIFPGFKAHIMKGIRVDNTHEYAGLYIYESMEVWQKYWKEDGTPTEKGAAAMGKLQPILEELNKLGTYTQTPSDWVVIGK